MTTLKEIESMEDWQAIRQASKDHPVVVFKHSTTCPISANAWSEYHKYLEANPTSSIEQSFVKVIESRPISLQIAEDIGLRHKSPQVLLLKNGEVVWNTSHWDITVEALSLALK